MQPPQPPRRSIYGGIPERGPGSFDGQLLAFAEDLREEGVAIGTSEMLDAFDALQEVPWTDREDFKEALAATLAKSPEDRRVFELVFERFFFRAAEAEATRQQISEGQGLQGAEDIDLDTLRRQIAEALRDGQEASMRDLARLAIAAFGRGEGSGVLGVDVQRIRRALGLRAEPQPDLPEDDPRRDGIPREQLRRFEAASASRARARPDRAHRPRCRPSARSTTSTARCPRGRRRTSRRSIASSPSSSAGSRRRGTSCAGASATRTSTCAARCGPRCRPAGSRSSSSSARKRPRRPEIFVLCDVSTSVTSASTFFLSVLHALHDSFRKLRSFVFIERISEVTDVFERERDFRAASEAIGRDAGVADISGYTDYGRVWTEFLTLIEDELHPRATVIVLGDARTNGRPPRDDVFAAITAKAGRTFWLNPEPRLYWNYGDSVIAAYERHCVGLRMLAHRPARGFRQGADDAGGPLLIAGADAPVVCVPVCRSAGARMLRM